MQEQENDQHREAGTLENRVLDVIHALLDEFGLVEREIERQIRRQRFLQFGDVAAYRFGRLQRIGAARFANLDRDAASAVVGRERRFLALGIAHRGDHAERYGRAVAHAAAVAIAAAARDDHAFKIGRVLKFSLYPHQPLGAVTDQKTGRLILILRADRRHHLFGAHTVCGHFVGVEKDRHFALHRAGNFDGADAVGTLQSLHDHLIGKI